MKKILYSYAIFLFSPMRAELKRKDVYAPTLHPKFTANTRDEAKSAARVYARKTLKLEENLKGNAQGKGAFELRLA